MIRLLLLFFCIFIISLISLALVYSGVTLGMFWVAGKLGFFTTAINFNNDFLSVLITNTTTPSVMFASIVTGMSCILIYRAIQKKQHLQIGHLVTIFKSFIFLSVFFVAGFYIVIMLFLSSGRTGILYLIPYIKYIGKFFDYGLPVMWLATAWFWIKKYESKFLNDEEEWMLR